MNLTREVVGRLGSVAGLQSAIALASTKLSDCHSGLTVQIQAFSQLLHVSRMAPAWGAALIEIVRRKEYNRIFSTKAREMAEVLAKFRFMEEKRRENFRTEIQKYLPDGLIKGKYKLGHVFMCKYE